MVVSPESGEGYRILCVFPVQVRSHFMMFEALMKGLARRGHQVDVVSGFPRKKPLANYTDVVALPVSGTTLTDTLSYEFTQTNGNNPVHFLATKVGNEACEALGDPGILRIVENPPTDPPYDLVITQIMTASCFIALGHRLKVPVVGVSSSALYPWAHKYVANPRNLAIAPGNLVTYVAPMTFWQRVHNVLHTTFSELYYDHLTSVQDEIIRKYLGEDAPGVREAENSLALVLVNSHPSVNGIKPTTPALIEVGGLHIDNDHPELQQDLRDWMDDSSDGFVYFSFGSMFAIDTLPERMIRVIYESLGKIAPMRVLMRTANPQRLPPGLPDNFRTFKWAPQLRVLKHKNIKAFVTHGGLMGTQEAIHCAVPLIGFPLMVDQFVNIDQYSKMKIAFRLRSFTVEAMDEALNEVLHNPVYKKKMQEISAKFLDRPMSALETATWWVEYAVRHKSNALRSPAMDLYWWQIQLFDVYAFILLTTIFIIYATVALIRFLARKHLINFRKG